MPSEDRAKAKLLVLVVSHRVGRARPYAVAIVASACALGVSLVWTGSAANGAPLLFLGAVAVSGWYGGLRPALVATALGALALDYFFESPPDYSLAVTDIHTLLNSLAYLVVAVLLGSLNAQLRTARRHAEDALVEAGTAVRARDEALAAVSHDMRTPLTAIQTCVAALQEADSPLPENVRNSLLGTIASERKRLEHFIRDAALGRIEAGIHPVPMLNAPGEIVSAILDRHMPMLGDRRIDFYVPDTLPLINFDAGLLEQALGNVLDNVAVHTPSGTRLAISGRIDEAGRLRLEIADSGPGIPAEERERIFRKFERLRSGRPGAGLGLALARAAIEAQGGQLWMAPSSMGGACFVLRLPAVQRLV